MAILTKPQKELLSEFYARGFSKVVLFKKERDEIWSDFKEQRQVKQKYDLINICPALLSEINRAIESGNNIQSAVFSECSYAQTLANTLCLEIFVDNRHNDAFLPSDVLDLLQTYNMYPRYTYSDKGGSRMLIQAGGCNGVDSALISVSDYNIFTIEFKEAGAKSSEPDLPKYGEDGRLIMTEEFEQNCPQFVDMLKQHIGLNVFKHMGHNENNFTVESIKIAISNNYNAKKFADVICTEDKSGYLTMIPANQVNNFAKLEGEIRTAGRNNYPVWTPIALADFIKEFDGKITNGIVDIPLENLTPSAPRGGSGISRYKINNLFFICAENMDINGKTATFRLDHIRQLNPTITAKMFFNDLDVNNVHDYYKDQL